MSEHYAEERMTEDDFEAALQQILDSARQADIDIRGGYYVESDSTTDFEIHITSVRR